MVLLIVIFIIVPIAELYVIFKIGDAIGWAPTLALLVVDSLLGTWLLRSQGRSVWRRFQDTMQAGGGPPPGGFLGGPGVFWRPPPLPPPLPSRHTRGVAFCAPPPPGVPPP